MLKIIFTKKAIENIKNIYNYIAQDNKVYALKQIDKIYNIAYLLQSNPYMGVLGRVENTREFFIPNTKYFVVYKVTSTTLYIINVIHTAKFY